VTGHSLGGGKAQAAVVGGKGALRGQMFNSAGLHPDVVGRPPEELALFAALCDQQRTTGGVSVGGGDPLTGLQMSLPAQRKLYGAVEFASNLARASRRGLEALGVEVGGARPASEETGLAGALGRRISGTAQEAAAANHRRFGWYVPPTLGQERTQTVVSKNADGTDSGLVAQHSIVNMINGYESRKIQDVERLVYASGTSVPLRRFIGPG
jgi:hypothetical protein